MKERWMGLDYGTKTVGVAVSDVLGITAQGVETVTRKSNKKLRQTLARIEALIEEYEVSKVVLGLPKNMNNTLGERAEETKEFQAMLQRRTGLEVVLWDERLTTMESERILQEGGVRRENRKERIDWMAATLILQSYMDAHPIPEKQAENGRKYGRKRFYMNNYQSIPFKDEDGKEKEFYVLEQTTLNGFHYLLVEDGSADADDEEVEVLIMKRVADAAEDEEWATYEMVEDEEELISVSKVFEQLMDDINFEVE